MDRERLEELIDTQMYRCDLARKPRLFYKRRVSDAVAATVPGSPWRTYIREHRRYVESMVCCDGAQASTLQLLPFTDGTPEDAKALAYVVIDIWYAEGMDDESYAYSDRHPAGAVFNEQDQPIREAWQRSGKGEQWLTSSVVSLAIEICKTYNFALMPILADALQDAGCDLQPVLSFCRGPGPFRQGCWLLSWIAYYGAGFGLPPANLWPGPTPFPLRG